MALSVLGFLDDELSITLTTDQQIAELGGRFGRAQRATDVLAFPLAEGLGSQFRGAQLGDVVISLETAERQALRRCTSLDQELRDLVIHGLLHVLGMDHRTEAQTRGMRALERHLRWEIERAQ